MRVGTGRSARVDKSEGGKKRAAQVFRLTCTFERPGARHGHSLFSLEFTEETNHCRSARQNGLFIPIPTLLNPTLGCGCGTPLV